MSNTIKDYDVIVIGAGSGLTAAHAAVRDGRSVAVVEAREDALGGTCVNRGCIPTKGLTHVADLMNMIGRCKDFGIKLDERSVSVDFPAVMNAIQRRRMDDAAQVKSWVDHRAYPQYERARFCDDRTLELEDGRRLRGASVFIATGARPAMPSIPGLTRDGVGAGSLLTNEDVLNLRVQPQRLIVLGGGYIGVEMAHFFSAIGTDVTIVERDVCLRGEDRDVRGLLVEALAKRMDLQMGQIPVRASFSGGLWTLELERAADASPSRISADCVLVATGRTPNTEDLELSATGVETDEAGWIRTDEHLRTDNPDVYAYGDVIGRGMFKHTSSYEGRLAYRNSRGGHERVSYRANPHAVFCDPQIGSVGLTVDECEARNLEHEAIRVDYGAVAKGRILGRPLGFAKAVLHPQTDEILGFHMVGPHAAELIHEVVVAMTVGDGEASAIRRAIHVHPTLSEVVRAAFDAS